MNLSARRGKATRLHFSRVFRGEQEFSGDLERSILARKSGLPKAGKSEGREKEEEDKGRYQGSAPGLKLLDAWPERSAASSLNCVSGKELHCQRTDECHMVFPDVMQEYHFSSSRKIAFSCFVKD